MLTEYCSDNLMIKQYTIYIEQSYWNYWKIGKKMHSEHLWKQPKTNSVEILNENIPIKPLSHHISHWKCQPFQYARFHQIKRKYCSVAMKHSWNKWQFIEHEIKYPKIFADKFEGDSILCIHRRSTMPKNNKMLYKPTGKCIHHRSESNPGSSITCWKLIQIQIFIRPRYRFN